MAPLAFFDGISQWWTGLDTPGQVFMGIGLAAGAVTLILLALTVFGLDHTDASNVLDIAPDGDASGHDGSLFSTRSVTAFFLGFGGGGSVTYQHTDSVLIACLVGTGIGAVLLYGIYRLGMSLMRLQSDGTIDYSKAVGNTGTVYISVPPQRAAGGQAQVTFSNRCEVINVISDSEKPIPDGTTVRVKERLADNLFLVETL